MNGNATRGGDLAPGALSATFGTAKRPERAPAKSRGEGVDDATVAALGKLSEAFEIVENARGHLYEFHRMSGMADLTLQDALGLLRDAGHHAMAEEIDDVLVGRDVVPGLWTFQLVEAYDDQYFAAFQAAERYAREKLVDGTRHVFEAEMKADEQAGAVPPGQSGSAKNGESPHAPSGVVVGE